MRLELDEGNCTSFSSRDIMHWHRHKAVVICVSYGTWGWPTFIIQLRGCWETWPQVFQISIQSRVVYVEGVLWESTPRLLFWADNKYRGSAGFNSFRLVWSNVICLIDRFWVLHYIHRWLFQEDLDLFSEKQEVRGCLASVPRVQSSCGVLDRK